MTESLANSIWLALLSAALTFLGSWFWFTRESARRALELHEIEDRKAHDRITELEKSVAVLSQSMLPLSAAFQAILVKELTHFHTPVMDALLQKLGPPYTISPAEEVQLRALLVERAAEMDGLLTESEREAAIMLPMVIKRVKTENAFIARRSRLPSGGEH